MKQTKVRNLLEKYPHLLKVVRERDCSFTEAIEYIKSKADENARGT